ncbi:hypothetical protein OF83DRAFT_1177075 [Amylostereum chailletii]|nr:hypothetical protein OF83DRAFT_1177075 [Amylostereum chailletii]
MIPGVIYNFLSPSRNKPPPPRPQPLIPSPPTPPSTFELLLQNTPLPPPGPEHFEARRALWTSPAISQASPSPTSSQSRMKLETLLNTPGALEDNQIWEGGLKRVWKSLVGGGRLKNLLPLTLVVRFNFFVPYTYHPSSDFASLGFKDKILYAGWLRDGTWPSGQHVPDDDDFFGADPQIAPPAPDDSAAAHDELIHHGRYSADMLD